MIITNYNDEVKGKIERVIEGFQDYIRSTPQLDVLWSEKLGYIYIGLDIVGGTIADMTSELILSDEVLFDKILYEMAVDIMEKAGHTLDPKEASELERREVERQLRQRTALLPEYQTRIPLVFERVDK